MAKFMATDSIMDLSSMTLSRDCDAAYFFGGIDALGLRGPHALDATPLPVVGQLLRRMSTVRVTDLVVPPFRGLYLLTTPRTTIGPYRQWSTAKLHIAIASMRSSRSSGTPKHQTSMPCPLDNTTRCSPHSEPTPTRRSRSAPGRAGIVIVAQENNPDTTRTRSRDPDSSQRKASTDEAIEAQAKCVVPTGMS
jgi:hypothetical protein